MFAKRLISRHLRIVCALIAGLVVLPINSAKSALVSYNSFSLYSSAISGRALTTINFDGLAAGTQLPNTFSGGIRYDHANAVNGNLIVTDGATTFSPNGLQTFSGSNYLGSDIGDLVRQSFTIDFQNPINSVGLFFISESQLESNESAISVNGTPSSISVATEIPLTGTSGRVGSFAYFVGLVETNANAGFTSVTISPRAAAPFLAEVGIDNLVFSAVPEPSTLTLLALIGAATIMIRSRTRVTNA
jgi:hypothetical protein